MQPRYPDIKVSVQTDNGSEWALMFKVGQLLLDNDVKTHVVGAFIADCQRAASHDERLLVISTWVTLTE